MIYLNHLTPEQIERVRTRARELCTCGGAGMQPEWPYPCAGHLRQAINEIAAADVVTEADRRY